jgi:hypothetical protein
MKSERKQEIEGIFVKLQQEGEYQETSTETDDYNCIAWALYDTQQWWWYTPRNGCYWPPGVPRDNKRQTVIRIFELHGYAMCDTDTPEPGYEKVAIYEHEGLGVQHAARQLQDGEWTSKLGEWEDIKHRTAQLLECDDYGKVVQILKRSRKEWDV